MNTTIRQQATLEVEVDGKAVVAALAALPDPNGGSWRPEVGDVGYLGTDDFPVEVTAVGVIVHEHGYVERVCQVSYLTDAWGWITTESAGDLAPEPWPLTRARWKRDRNVGEYPPYEKVAEWRARQATGEPREMHKGLEVTER